LVDKNLVLRKISQLDEYHSQILEFAQVTAAEYSAEWKTRRIVERTLQVMIELTADIGHHIIADQGLRTPDSYADTFRVLGEAEIIDASLSSMMQSMAGFRNVVVHGYDKIDEGIVISILSQRLGDFILFKDAVLAFIKAQDEE